MVLGVTHTIHPAYAVENELNTQSATYLSINRMEEPPKSGKGSIPYSNKNSEHIDNSLKVIPDASFKRASDNKSAIFESNKRPAWPREQEVQF